MILYYSNYALDFGREDRYFQRTLRNRLGLAQSGQMPTLLFAFERPIMGIKEGGRT